MKEFSKFLNENKEILKEEEEQYEDPREELLELSYLLEDDEVEELIYHMVNAYGLDHEDEELDDWDEEEEDELDEAVVKKKVVRNGRVKIVRTSSKPGYIVKKEGGKFKEVLLKPAEQRLRSKIAKKRAKKLKSRKTAISKKRQRSIKKRTF